MIVKNERENLEELLPPLKYLFDEICIADTGSTDGTAEYAMSMGAKVTRAPWRDNFSWARNQSLGLCTARYVMWLDADDRIDPMDVWAIRLFLEKQIPEVCLFLWLVCTNEKPELTSECHQLRVFPNIPGMCWDRRRIHEQIITACEKYGVQKIYLPSRVYHIGYHKPSDTEGKYARNLRLLELEEEDGPVDIAHVFHVAQTLSGLGRSFEAYEKLTKLIAICGENEMAFAREAKGRAYILQQQILVDLTKKECVTLCEAGLAAAPWDDLARTVLAQRYYEIGDHAKARETIGPVIAKGGATSNHLPFSIVGTNQLAQEIWRVTEGVIPKPDKFLKAASDYIYSTKQYKERIAEPS